jgi:hypothetical protein
MNFTSITTMNFINTFKRLYFQHGKTPLGRWNIHNYKETTLKIDYANEDNCGISSNKQKHLSGWKIHNYPHKNNYGMSTRDYRNILYTAKAKEKERKQQQQDDDKYMFMMGFESAHN